MATQSVLGSALPLVCLARNPRRSKAFRSSWLWPLLFLCSIPAHAQFQQPFVFSTAGAVLTRNDQTGVLTPVQGSPFAAAQFQTLDVQGRFLFGVGTNSIHMYQINSTTGAFSEVPTSPFASPNTNQPLFIAVESTGQYIAVINKAGKNPGESSIETFQINAANLSLAPVQGSFLELDSSVIGAGADLQNRHFYAFLGPNLSSANQQLQSNSELNDYVLDSQTGLVSLFKGTQPGNVGRCFSMDSQGRFLAIGQGQFEGQVGVFPIAANSGALGTGSITPLASSVFPIELFAEVTGNFLYLTDAIVPAPPVHIFAIDPQTQALTETSSSPLPGFASVPGFMGDPTGPFMYGFVGTSIGAYMTDPITGYFTVVAGTSISAPGVNGNFVFSILPGQQNIVGPVATWTPTALSLGSITVGTPSPAQMTVLSSTGGQGLSLSAIAITGANAGEFSETDNCGAPTVLAPSKSCTISVIFTPTASGLQQATLTATDNAPGSPQSVQLSGTGIAPPPPQPAVTLTPGSVSFPTTTEGTTSSPITVTLTNSGTATLHVSSVVMGGNNPSDFNMSNSCNGAYAANATCSIAVTFAPLAVGQRAATITITDDAPNSPQLVQLSGTASSPPSTNPAVSFMPASVSFSTTTEGTSNGPQTVTVTSSGAAALHISSVVLGGANAGDYSITNGCTAAAYPTNATCTINVMFAPLTTGPRVATITFSDDAPNSPQVISVGGNANPAVTAGPAPGGSSTASVSAGQTAKYQLQLIPGPGFTGSISLACSGAPFGAACQVPASLSVTSGAALPFTVTVTTSGTASLPPWIPTRARPIVGLRILVVLVLALVLLIFANTLRTSQGPPITSYWARSTVLTVIALCTLIQLAGCGGGSAGAASAVPAPLTTPSGTSTITVTLSAMSASGKPLQLQPIQLTLTVN
jgi:hypothetical protein